MEHTLNLLEIKVEGVKKDNDVIELTDKISVKMRYPKFSILKNIKDMQKMTDIAMQMIAESIEYIYDGKQFYYSNEVSVNELVEFVESLSQKQFEKIENFFRELPKLERKIEMTCSKCGFVHKFNLEGLENFFE